MYVPCLPKQTSFFSPHRVVLVQMEQEEYQEKQVLRLVIMDFDYPEAVVTSRYQLGTRRLLLYHYMIESD